MFCSKFILTHQSPLQVIGRKIGAGTCRDVFEVVPYPELLVKRVRDSRLVNIKKDQAVNWSIRFSSKLRWFINDINKFESKIYRKLAPQLYEYLPKILFTVKENSEVFLFSEKITDYDGRLSRSIDQLPAVTQISFWKRTERLKALLLIHRIYLFDIFHKGNNLIVQKVSPTDWRPMLVDVKRLGRRFYPFQISLFFKGERLKKFNRRLELFEKNFKPTGAT